MDVNREMTRVALRVVGRTVFAADVESEAPEIAAVLDAGMRVFHRFLLPGAELLWRLPLPATRRFNAAKRDIDAFLERLIREHAAALGGADLVSVLAGLQDVPLNVNALQDVGELPSGAGYVNRLHARFECSSCATR